MKKNILNLVVICILFFLNMQTFAAKETFTLDPDHTYLIWHINHLGFSTQTGKWYATGTLQLDKDHPENSKVNATIKVANMITGIPELDKHLKGDLFFDVKKYPTATFASDKVEMTGSNTAKVYGTLTLHGVSKPVVLDVTLNKEGVNPITNKMSAGFSATTTIKRSDFNMNALLPALGDDVQINIEAEGYKS